MSLIDFFHTGAVIENIVKQTSDELKTNDEKAGIIIEGLNDGRADSIDEYCFMNRPSEIERIDVVEPQSFDDMFRMPHDEYLAYLWRVHGKPTCDYFLTSSKTVTNTKIERRGEGLMLHHISEECGVDMMQLTSIPTAKKKPFEIYRGNNFVYCDYFEHLLIHIKIALEDLERGRHKLNGIDLAGAKILWRELNKYFATGKALILRKYAIERIKDRYSEYIQIMSALAKLIKNGHQFGQYCTVEELAQDETGFVHQKILKEIK